MSRLSSTWSIFWPRNNTSFHDDAMVQMITQIEDFDPSKLIAPGKGVVNGWRNSLKITTPNGKMFNITVGEGRMMSELKSKKKSESGPENDFESLGLES